MSVYRVIVLRTEVIVKASSDDPLHCLFSAFASAARRMYSACSSSGRSPFFGLDIRADRAAIRISSVLMAILRSSAETLRFPAFCMSSQPPSNVTSFSCSKRIIRVDVFVPTHYVEEINDRDTVVKKVQIVPLEVIIRNIAAGSFSKHYGVEEGTLLKAPTIEFSYKNDELGDPLINDYHALALGLATQEEIDTIKKYAFKVNEELKAFWKSCGVTLVDFKLEFGRLSDGTIVLADEISPDTCRLWDSETGMKLDKDRFRRDMGGVEDAYQEIMRRLQAHG